MKKKLIILIIFVLSNIVFINNVLAKSINCSYEGSINDTRYTYDFVFDTENYDNTEVYVDGKKLTVYNNIKANKTQCPENVYIFRKSDTSISIGVSPLLPISDSSGSQYRHEKFYLFDSSSSSSSQKDPVDKYENYDDSKLLSCGGKLSDIPSALPKVTSTLYTVIQIVVPILLVIFGMIDLVKGVIAQKDEEIKNGQRLLLKKIIVAIAIFFMFVIVKFIISIAADSSSGIIECAECFIENKCSSNKE